MDSQKATEKLEEVQNELNCSICHDYFVQAMTLSCSHSFCLKCINAWREAHSDCPVCRREILGMAPSRALDNMVAALVNRKNSEAAVQEGLQQFGVWLIPATAQQNQPQNVQQHAEQLSDFDYVDESDDDSDDYWFGGEDEEDSNSTGSYDAGEEDNESEEEEDEEYQDEEEENDEDDTNSSGDSEDVDLEYSDDDDDEDDNEEHAKWSNQNNPNNHEYWKMRGWSGRPDNWKELIHRQ